MCDHFMQTGFYWDSEALTITALHQIKIAITFRNVVIGRLILL